MASSSGGKKPPPPTGSAPSYSAAADKTLTPAQAKAAGFRPDVVKTVTKGLPIKKESFRSPSNPTKAGFKTGYHEAFATTDTVDTLAQRKVGKGGTSTMPAKGSGVFKKYAGKPFLEKNLKPVLEASDGARTDTSRTILSVPGGGVAGHSGSGVKTTGQNKAHDALRHQTMRVLQDAAVTPEAVGVIAGATAVFSMAPGQLANKAKDVKKLKDAAAALDYEPRRNKAKRKLSDRFDDLSPSEQGVVTKHMKRFEQDFPGRTLAPGRPSTPPRDETTAPGAFLSGGGYLAPMAPHAPMTPAPMFTSAPPVGLSPMLAKPVAKKAAAATPGEVAMDITQPFRTERR